MKDLSLQGVKGGKSQALEGHLESGETSSDILVQENRRPRGTKMPPECR